MNRRRRSERGMATIEVIGIIPLAAMIIGAIIQLYMVGMAAVAAESSSRVAAREFSKGASTSEAEAAGLADVNTIFSPDVEVAGFDLSAGGEEPAVPGGGSLDDPVSARASLEVPFLGIGVDGLNIEVTRYAVMPRTAD